MTKKWQIIFGFLILVLILTWLAALAPTGSKVKIIACDVGQGDAILVTYKNTQILTDGGLPNGKVLTCLSNHMPFYDRQIEVVINTHPQLDHYGGLISVFKNYKVDYFIANGLDASASGYQLLAKEVGSSGAQVVNPVAGMTIRYDLLHFDIFWPTTSFLTSEGDKVGTNSLSTFSSKRDPNDFSIQALLSFGEFDALLTGDIEQNLETEVLQNFILTQNQTVEYIKVPHHGSNNAMTAEYLEVIGPKVAVISSGQNNSYGHPTKEILDLLTKNNIQIKRTDVDGEVVVETDGKSWSFK